MTRAPLPPAPFADSWHIQLCAVTPVTGLRPGTRAKTIVFLGFRGSYIDLWSLATRPGDCPSPEGSPAKTIYVYVPFFETGKRGHYERGLFTGGNSRISKISRKWSDSHLFPQSRGSLESLKSLESLEHGLFWKDPFSKRPLFLQWFWEWWYTHKHKSFWPAKTIPRQFLHVIFWITNE